MSRIRLVLCLTLVLGGLSAVADAQVHHKSAWHAFWGRVGLDFHRMNAWPEPFLTADRQLTRCIWMPMIARGWQYENTLTDFHFDADSGELTTAAIAKIRWISTQAPADRRTIFVMRGHTNEQTEARVDLVQREATNVLAEGPLPAVVRTNQQPHGFSRTGNYQNLMWQSLEGSIQAPALPASAGGGGGQ